jgi:hypothetical protein
MPSVRDVGDVGDAESFVVFEPPPVLGANLALSLDSDNGSPAGKCFSVLPFFLGGCFIGLAAPVGDILAFIFIRRCVFVSEGGELGDNSVTIVAVSKVSRSDRLGARRILFRGSTARPLFCIGSIGSVLSVTVNENAEGNIFTFRISRGKAFSPPCWRALTFAVVACEYLPAFSLCFRDIDIRFKKDNRFGDSSPIAFFNFSFCRDAPTSPAVPCDSPPAFSVRLREKKIGLKKLIDNRLAGDDSSGF